MPLTTSIAIRRNVFTLQGSAIESLANEAKFGRPGCSGAYADLGYHVVNALGNYTPPVDRTYLTAVQSGQVHIGDTRCLIPEVARVLAVAAEVTEQGYELVSRTNPSLTIQLDLDFNSAGQPLVCISRMLCRAERQRFQQALQLNKRLSFGRIAISETDGGEFFSIVDRRLYKPANASQLSKIIKTIMAESQKIIDGKLLY